jgi:hypothetical protein
MGWAERSRTGASRREGRKMARPQRLHPDRRLLQVLKDLEEAVFEDYGMMSDPLPRTAAALQEARVVIREARAQIDLRAARRPGLAS